MRRVLRPGRATLAALYPSYLQWSGIGLEPMAARNASTPSADGLVVLRASRLEALLQPLQTLLASTRPDNVLVAQTVVAAHPGMKHWLTRELARLAGTAGVVANLDIILPGVWLERLAQRQLGRSEERRVGKECVSTCRSRWWSYH